MPDNEFLNVPPGVMRQLHQLSGHVSPVPRSIPRRRAPWAVEPEPQSRLLNWTIIGTSIALVAIAIWQISAAAWGGRL
jgi:hypothetical protein